MKYEDVQDEFRTLQRDPEATAAAMESAWALTQVMADPRDMPAFQRVLTTFVNYFLQDVGASDELMRFIEEQLESMPLPECTLDS